MVLAAGCILMEKSVGTDMRPGLWLRAAEQ
jgi:hypothetical protein